MMLNSDGEIEGEEEDGETHQERHAATLALAQVRNQMHTFFDHTLFEGFQSKKVGPTSKKRWGLMGEKLTKCDLCVSQTSRRKIKGDRDSGRDLGRYVVYLLMMLVLLF